MYNPIPCTQEELYPTRWIIRQPSRDVVADHLRHLLEVYGSPTALECRRRMMWVGIFPVSTTKQRELRRQ